MQHLDGLNRTETAAFIARRIGRAFNERTLRYWETHALVRPVKVRPGGRGPFCPVIYRLQDLIAAEILATLRVDGASLQSVRRALDTLEQRFPDVTRTPARWYLAVTLGGDVVRVEPFENERALVSLAKRPGQLCVFNAGQLVREAREAIEQRRAA